MMQTDYREHLARRGIAPLRIERTMKRGGDVVLDSVARGVRIVPGKHGQFAGRAA